MDLQSHNIDEFIKHCIQKAKDNCILERDTISETSSAEEQNSLLIHYMDRDDGYKHTSVNNEDLYLQE